MVIDIHVHPFCKEATVTPSVQEAVKRMFERHQPQLREMYQQGVTYLFTERTTGDIIREMDEAGVEKACIVSMDLTTHYGVELVTNEDVARMASAYPDRFIPFAA